MSVTQSQVGTLYIPRYNNIAWTQPLGPGTTVYPTQNNGAFLNFPVPGQFFGESSEALWHPGCNHGINEWRIFRDYDPEKNQSAAVICCSVCSFISSIREPYEVAFSDQYPIIVG